MPEINGDGESADILFLNPDLNAALAAARDTEPEPLSALVPRPADSPENDTDTDTDTDPDVDHESVIIDRDAAGPPVDPPDEPRPVRADAGRVRAPVIPPGLASRSALAGTLRWAAGEARYHAAFHALRAPKYAVKTAVFAPAGVDT